MTSPERIRLTAEERFLWECARHWRDPVAPADAGQLDWARIVEATITNRAQTLVHGFLQRGGLLEQLPDETRASLQEKVDEIAETAATMAEPLCRYLRLAAEAGVDTVVMKGLSVSMGVYGDPAIRPGSDIDLLVRETQLGGSLAVLGEMGFGRWWPKLMEDGYYARHHLHQLRCDPEIEVWVEVHWTLDHPYTLLTMDMDALMDRTSSGELLGAPVRDLSLPDLLLSLSVHLVKHAVYLPSVLDRPDLARIILADGMLVYFMDVAEAIKLHSSEIDWDLCVRLAKEWGAVNILGAVLRACAEFLEAPVPAGVLESLPLRAPRGVTRWAMNRMADHEIAEYQHAETGRLWSFLLSTNDALILRPIRILDAFSFLFPGGDYLRRRYGSTGSTAAMRHLVRAASSYAQLAVDSVVYGWKRRQRIRYHDKHGVVPDAASGPSE